MSTPNPVGDVQYSFYMDLDALARQAAHGQSALDLELGETLLRLFDGDRLLRLGYARQTDYAKERLGVSVRLLLSWTALARGLTSRPILRAAVLAGSVTASKARVVMAAAQGERESTWTAAAMGMRLANSKSASAKAASIPPWIRARSSPWSCR